MRLPQLKNGRKWNYLGFAFAIPIVFMLVFLIGGKCSPFGDYSLLYSDMYHQYFPFFKAFREALRSGDSLLYSWDVGMGLDYLGLISYYLASPLYLLSVFVSDAWVLEFFSLLMPIKLGLASLFFAIFLKKMFHRDDLSLPLFGAFYAMCAWALGYQWNIMWLDTFALLPLVALGTVSLLRDKKFILYTISLFFSILSNYYIGFFTCIFVLLVFICYQICRCKSIKGFFNDLFRIALFSILAIGMTAILELPALAALGTTQSSVNTYPEDFSVNIVSGELVTKAKTAWKAYKTAKEAGTGDLFGLWWDAIKSSVPPLWEGMVEVAGNMNGGLTPTFKEGLPNLYCGVGTIFFAFLFLTTRHVKLRDKICAVCMLVFLMLSFIIRQLDYIWHGFHFTNMIPYRFSFLFCFIMLYMAYRAFLLLRRLQLWQIFMAGAMSFTIITCAKEYQDDSVFLAYNGVFFLLYFAVMVLYKADPSIPKDADMDKRRSTCLSRIRRRSIATTLLAVVMGIELIMNMVNFGINFPRTYALNYPKGTDAADSMLSYMENTYEPLRDNTLFYRTEVTHSQTLNDGALLGYHGISTFTSSANVKVTEFMRILGYGAKNTYNGYCFEESSPVSNLFLNLKYMLERDGKLKENPYFDEVTHQDSVYLLQNNAWLPLGFLAQPELAELQFQSYTSPFQFQNVLFSTATGIFEDVWYMTHYSWLEVTGNNVEIKNSSNGYTSYKAGSNGGTLIYTYTAQKSGFMCLDLTMNARNTYNVYKNGSHLFTEGISLPQTISVCQVEPGDVIEVRATCKANESSNMTIRAALLNEEVFRRGYDVLNASTLELTEFSNTRVEGMINCNRDGLMYTSIPQNGTNWHVYVDGQEVEPILVGNVMISLPLTEGEHTITFVYKNEAFDLGWKVSVVCLLIFLAIIAVNYYPRYKHILDKIKAKLKK